MRGRCVAFRPGGAAPQQYELAVRGASGGVPELRRRALHARARGGRDAAGLVDDVGDGRDGHAGECRHVFQLRHDSFLQPAFSAHDEREYGSVPPAVAGGSQLRDMYHLGRRTHPLPRAVLTCLPRTLTPSSICNPYSDTVCSAQNWNSRCLCSPALACASPLATRRTCSKTRAPTSSIFSVPSMTPPADRSMSRDMRSKTSLLDASLTTGAMALPMVVPRPVVKTMMVAPAATSPGVDSWS